MNLQKTKAFTLVELIVVITILAILGTIAFISLAGYSKSSRDSVRISDVSKMKTSLELFHIDAGKYPLPDNGSEVSYEGELLRTQGNFGETVRQTLSRNLNEIPTDPLSNIEYTYSTSNNRNEFQILNLLETELSLNTFNKANASETKRIAKIDGQYNGVFIKTLSYIVPVPSIINSEVSGGLILDSNNIKSQIVDGGDNMLGIGNISSQTGQLDINLSVYTGSLVSDDLDSKKAAVMSAIQGAYSGSILADIDIYEYILNITDESELAGLTDIIVLKNGASSLVLSGGNNTPNSTNRLVYNAVAYTGNGTSQDIETGIESYDINYDETRTYSKGSGNNTEYAFDRETFKLYKYINNTPSDGSINLYGDDLIINGTFVSNYNGWTAEPGTNSNLAISSGKLRVYHTSTNTYAAQAYQLINTNIDSIYKVEYQINGYDPVIQVKSEISNALHYNMNTYNNQSTTSSKTGNFEFTATTNSTRLMLLMGDQSANSAYYDNILLKEKFSSTHWEEVTDDIVIPFKSSKVWVKQRNIANFNYVFDTLRGVTNRIFTDGTYIETSSPNSLISFNNNGFRVGSDNGVNVGNYVAWQKAYHKMKITTTNHGKRALVAFDDVSKRSMTLYQGSSIETTDHEIPHGLGLEPDMVTYKDLNDGGTAWGVYNSVSGIGKMMFLNWNNIESNNVSFINTNPTNSTFSINESGSANISGHNIIAYSEANSDNIKIGTYNGTGVSGNSIITGFKPAYVAMKRVDGIGHWIIVDNKRNNGGISNFLYANEISSENTDTLYNLITTDIGFEINGGNAGAASWSHWNELNGEYLYIAYGDSNGDGGGSYVTIPTGY